MRFLIMSLLLLAMNVTYPTKTYDKLFPCKEVFDICCSLKNRNLNRDLLERAISSGKSDGLKSALIPNRTQKAIPPIARRDDPPSIINNDDDYDWPVFLGWVGFILCLGIYDTACSVPD